MDDLSKWSKADSIQSIRANVQKIHNSLGIKMPCEEALSFLILETRYLVDIGEKGPQFLTLPRPMPDM